MEFQANSSGNYVAGRTYRITNSFRSKENIHLSFHKDSSSAYWVCNAIFSPER
jgi:hypothetical protein